MTKHNNQKFKFEALEPFMSESKVKFINNTYIIQVRIKNTSVNRIFLESLEFRNKVSKDLQLVDLNQTIKNKKPDDLLNTRGDSNTSLDSDIHHSLFDQTVCFE